MVGACSTYGERRMLTGFWWGNLNKERTFRWENVIKIFHAGAWTGLIWLRTGTSCRLL